MSQLESNADLPPQLVVLSGPSGSGKTTIVERLLVESPVKLMKSVSATTRPSREGEVHGEAYYFLSSEEFEQKRARGAFLEYAEVFQSGYWYGTLKSEIERAAAESAWAFLEIDVQGALNVMQSYPKALTVFLRTSSELEYEQRLRNRGTESEDVIQRRLSTAREELQSADHYRFQVINDDLDTAVSQIVKIITEEEQGLHA